MTNEKLVVNRTLGFEIEAGTNEEYEEMSVPYSDCGYDGSIEARGYQVETRTDPINNLNHLKEIYDRLNDAYDMRVDRSCGLHIHCDTSDYKVIDYAKLLRFGKGIEKLMFGLVDSSRADWNFSCHKHNEPYNEYTRAIQYNWRNIFRKSFLGELEINWDGYSNIQDVISFINREKGLSEKQRLWNGKYQWINTRTPYPTVEFRIFHATKDYQVTQKFGMLVYHIIETVKHSDIKQLNFIIKSIHEQSSVEEMYNKLFDSIGLDSEFRPSIVNEVMAEHIHEKFIAVAEQAEAI